MKRLSEANTPRVDPSVSADAISSQALCLPGPLYSFRGGARYKRALLRPSDAAPSSGPIVTPSPQAGSFVNTLPPGPLPGHSRSWGQGGPKTLTPLRGQRGQRTNSNNSFILGPRKLPLAPCPLSPSGPGISSCIGDLEEPGRRAPSFFMALRPPSSGSPVYQRLGGPLGHRIPEVGGRGIIRDPP
jgi:hypothetical protein